MSSTHSDFAKQIEVCIDIPWSHRYSHATTCPCWWQSQDWQDLSSWIHGYEFCRSLSRI